MLVASRDPNLQYPRGSEPLKILVVGSDGMLGRDVMSILSKDPEVMGVSQTALQLADFERVREIFTRYRPVVVIHAAEATDLDRCEAHPWEALHINALGTQNIVTACQEVDAALLYLSSDQVFSGARRGPYVEWDTPRPVNIYGHTKMAGEMAVKDHLRKFFIVRTSTVYGPGTPGFVQEVLQAGKEGRPFKAASDEVACPTFNSGEIRDRNRRARAAWVSAPCNSDESSARWVLTQRCLSVCRAPSCRTLTDRARAPISLG